MPLIEECRNPVRFSPDTSWQRVTTLLGLSQQQQTVVNRLRELAELPAGWDGVDAPPLREPVKLAALSLVNDRSLNLAPVPHVGPVLGGGMQLEWQVGSRGLEIEILPDGAMQYLVAMGEETLEGSLYEDMLEPLFLWLMQC